MIGYDIEIVKCLNNQKVTVFAVASSSRWTSIAIEIVNENNQPQYKVLPKPKDSPTLYCDFPLVGSEKSFIYPAFVNSHLFWPNEERSSIIL